MDNMNNIENEEEFLYSQDAEKAISQDINNVEYGVDQYSASSDDQEAIEEEKESFIQNAPIEDVEE
jgi:hypothetical protein